MQGNKKGLIEVIQPFLKSVLPGDSKLLESLTSERLQKNLGVMVDNCGLLDEKIKKELKDNIEKMLEAQLSDETSAFLASLSGLVSQGLSDKEKCFPLFLTLLEHVFDRELNLKVQELLPKKEEEPLAASLQNRQNQTSEGLTAKIEVIKELVSKICKDEIAEKIIAALTKVGGKSSVNIEKVWKEVLESYFSDTRLGDLAPLLSQEKQKKIQFFTKPEHGKKTLTALYGTFLLEGNTEDKLATGLGEIIKAQGDKKEIIKKLSGLDEEDTKKNEVLNRLKEIVEKKEDNTDYNENELLDKIAERFSTENYQDELVKQIVDYDQKNSDAHEAIKAKLKSIIIETRYPNINKQAELIAEFAKIVTKNDLKLKGSIDDSKKNSDSHQAKQKIIELLFQGENLETGLDLILDFVKVERTKKQKQLLTDLGLDGDKKDLNVKDVIHKFLQDKKFQEFLSPLAIEPIKLLVDGQYENITTVKQNIKKNLDNLVENLKEQEKAQQGTVKKGFFSGKSDITECKEKAKKLAKKVTTLEGKKLEEKVKSLLEDVKKAKQAQNIPGELTQNAKKITELETEQEKQVKDAKDLKSKIKKACEDLQEIKGDSKIDKKTKQNIEKIRELVTLDNLPQLNYDKDKFGNEIKNFARFLSLSSFELGKELEAIKLEVNGTIENGNEITKIGDLKKQITEYHKLVSQLIGIRAAELLSLLTQEDFSKCEADKVLDIIGQTISDIYNINDAKQTGKVIYSAIKGSNAAILRAKAITTFLEKEIAGSLSAVGTNITQVTGEIEKLKPQEIVERLFSGNSIETVKAIPEITKNKDSLKDQILTVVKMKIARSQNLNGNSVENIHPPLGRTEDQDDLTGGTKIEEKVTGDDHKPKVAIGALKNPPTQPRSQSCDDITTGRQKAPSLARSKSVGDIPSRVLASTQTDITEKPTTVINLTRKEFEIKLYILMFALCALSSVMFTVNHFKNNLILFYASAAVATIAFVTLIVKGTIDYRKSKNPEVNFVDSVTSVSGSNSAVTT